MCENRGIPPTLLAWATESRTSLSVVEKWEEIWHGVKILVNLKQGVVKASKVLEMCGQIFGWDLSFRQLSPEKRDVDFLTFLIRSFHDEESYRVLAESELKRGGREDKFYLVSLLHGRQTRFISSLEGPKRGREEVNKVVPQLRHPGGDQISLVSFSGGSRVPGYIPNPLLTPEQQEIQIKWRREQEEREARRGKGQGQGQSRALPQSKGHQQGSASKKNEFPTLSEAADSSGKGLSLKKPSSNLSQGPKSWNKLF